LSLGQFEVKKNLYVRTAGEERLPRQSAKTTLGSGYPSPYERSRSLSSSPSSSSSPCFFFCTIINHQHQQSYSCCKMSYRVVENV
jgi:hypothetical protein